MRIGSWALVLAACGGSDAKLQQADAPSGNDTPAPAALAMSPAETDFGSVGVGTHSATVRFTISNPGGSATSSLSVFTGGDFTLDATTCTSTLAVGASCTVDVACTPQSIGAKTGVLTASAGIVTMVTAQLTASAVSSENGLLTISPATHDFGSVGSSTTSPATTVTVTNAGGTTVTAVTVTLSGQDPTAFTLSNNLCAGATLAGGETCKFDVAFAPTDTGAKSAVFSITGSGTGETTGGLSGTGVTDRGGFIVIDPPILDYAMVALGSTRDDVSSGLRP